MAGRNRIVVSKDVAREEIAKGIHLVAEVIGSTIGPKGRNVIIDTENGIPIVSNDGVTIARKLNFSSPMLNLGAGLARQASERSDEVGDGTSSTVVLTDTFIKEGLKQIAQDEHPQTIKEGMEEALEVVVDKIKNRSTPIKELEDIRKIAYIASNNDDNVADLITEAFDAVGVNGHITFEVTPENESRIETIEGIHLPEVGWKSPYFMNDEILERCVLDNPKIFILNKHIEFDFITGAGKLLETLSKETKSFLLFVDTISSDALTTFVINAKKKKLLCVVVQCPGFGPRRTKLLEDLSAATGATIIDDDNPIPFEKNTMEQLGDAKSVIVTENDLTIKNPGGSPEALQGRIETLNKQIKTLNSKQGNNYEIEKIKERISLLSSGVATVYVGGKTKIEAAERRLRVEDSLYAVKAALSHGVVVGGGLTLLRIQRELQIDPPEFFGKIGAKIVIDGLDKITRKIIENADTPSTDMLMSQILEMGPEYQDQGYNGKLGVIMNLREAGVLDATEVLIGVIKNAVSIATILLTTDAVLILEPENLDKRNPMLDMGLFKKNTGELT